MKRLCSTLLLAATLLLPAIAAADEAEERIELRMQSLKAFGLGRHAELERMFEQARTRQTRTSSGVWALTILDDGLANAFKADPRNDEMWAQQEARVQAWQEAYPKSAAARLAQAKLLLSRAWRYRGDGYAGTVKEADWAPFHDYVGRARAYLEHNKAIASVDPRWYDYMEDIAMYQQWPKDEFAALVDEGLSRHPTYYPLYFTGVGYHLPKWGGSAEEVEAFARAAVARSRKTDGEGMYARIYWVVAGSQYGDDLVLDSRVDWAMMKRGMHDVLARYPDAWNLNNFAQFACAAGDREETAKLIRRLGDEPDPQVWRTPGQFERCRDGDIGPLKVRPRKDVPGRTTRG